MTAPAFPLLLRWPGDPLGAQGLEVRWAAAMPLPQPGGRVAVLTYYGRYELLAVSLRWEVIQGSRDRHDPLAAPVLILDCELAPPPSARQDAQAPTGVDTFTRKEDSTTP